MHSLRFLLTPVLVFALMGAASKPKISLRFHTEANPKSGESFTSQAVVPGSDRPVTLAKYAEISESDVVAIYPFQAADGSWGCMLKLNEHGRIALLSLSGEYRGTLLFGFLNTRPVTAMLIDKRITDGILVIARGLVPEEVEALCKAFPVLNEKGQIVKQSKSSKSSAKKPVKPAKLPKAQMVTPTEAAAPPPLPAKFQPSVAPATPQRTAPLKEAAAPPPLPAKFQPNVAPATLQKAVPVEESEVPPPLPAKFQPNMAPATSQKTAPMEEAEAPPPLPAKFQPNVTPARGD